MPTSASARNGSARASARASAPTPSACPSASRNCTTFIRFSVRVPVLSVHRTDAAPSVSIAEARRVSTRALEMRHAPIAMKTASTMGNSSGSIDMPTAIPARTACNQSPRNMPYSPTTARLTSPPVIARIRTSRLIWRCRCGVSVSSSASEAPIRPSSVRDPVAVTSATPLPRTISDPEKTWVRPSPPARVASGRAPWTA